jgi:hypothetical protein
MNKRFAERYKQGVPITACAARNGKKDPEKWSRLIANCNSLDHRGDRVRTGFQPAPFPA